MDNDKIACLLVTNLIYNVFSNDHIDYGMAYQIQARDECQRQPNKGKSGRFIIEF